MKAQAEFVTGALSLEASFWEQGLYKNHLIYGEGNFTSMPPIYPVWQMLVSAGNTGQWYLLHLNTLSKLLWLFLFWAVSNVLCLGDLHGRRKNYPTANSGEVIGGLDCCRDGYESLI